MEQHDDVIDGENRESVVSTPLAFVFLTLSVESLTTSGSFVTNSTRWPREGMEEAVMAKTTM